MANLFLVGLTCEPTRDSGDASYDRMVAFDLAAFVESCLRALDESEPLLALRELVCEATSDGAGIDRALGAPSRWRVEDLHVSPQLTVQRIVWGPGVRVAPHEHRMWAITGVYGGKEEQSFYRIDNGQLVAAGGTTLAERDVQLLGPDAIHAVLNPLPRLTAALHIYGGDLNATERRAFDPRTGRARVMDRELSDRFVDLVAERQATDPGPWEPERTLALQAELYPQVYGR